MTARKSVYTERVGVRDELGRPLIEALKAKGYKAKQSPWGEVGWVDHNAPREVVIDAVSSLGPQYPRAGT
jgi:hypothetical protein